MSPLPVEAPDRAALSMSTPTPLSTLLSDAQHGDDQAWRELIGRFGGLVVASARLAGLHQSAIEDVVQMTWLLLMLNFDSIRNVEALPGWLRTTAHREALRIASRSNREILVPEEPTYSVENDCTAEVLDQMERRQLIAAVANAMTRLPNSDRQLLEALFLLEDRPSYRELSELLGVPIGSIGPTRSRALTRLRALLDER